jgi:hypothetical protein
MSDPKKTEITVVVNGKPAEIFAVEDQPIGAIIPDALEQTGNTGQPPENWELRDAEGNLLDLNKNFGDYAFSEKDRLFLNLKAGVGGGG